MKISQKGLYGLQALSMLARHPQELSTIHDIAAEEHLPEKFLDLILVELKNARLVESTRGAKGGYRLRKPATDIHLGEVIRLLDGPLSPFCDADELRTLIQQDGRHRALYQVFLDIRDATARIVDNTSVADIMGEAESQVSSKELLKAREGSNKDPAAD